jgi:hypothetical protein
MPVPGVWLKSALRFAAKSIPHFFTTLLAVFTWAAIACLSLARNESSKEAEDAVPPGEADRSISPSVLLVLDSNSFAVADVEVEDRVSVDLIDAGFVFVFVNGKGWKPDVMVVARSEAGEEITVSACSETKVGADADASELSITELSW